MSLGENDIHLELILDNPIVNVKVRDEISRVLYNLPTINNDLVIVPVELELLPEEIPTVVYKLPTVNNELVVVPIDFELLPFDYLVTLDDLLIGKTLYGAIAASYIQGINVRGRKTTHGVVSRNFITSIYTHGSKVINIKYGVINRPFTLTIATAGSASSPSVPPAFKAVGALADGHGLISTLQPALPSGWAAGDFAIALGYVDVPGANTINTADSPAGWTNLINLQQDTAGIRVFYRRLQAGDSDPLIDLTGSGSWSTGESQSAVVCTFTGVHATSPIDGSPVSNSGFGSPCITAGVTTSYDNSLLVTLLGRGDNEGFTTETYGGSATGVSELFDLPSLAGNDSEIAAFAKALSPAGASGVASAATSPTDPWVAVTLALRRASS